jgi:hypothetical protein
MGVGEMVKIGGLWHVIKLGTSNLGSLSLFCSCSRGKMREGEVKSFRFSVLSLVAW